MLKEFDRIFMKVVEMANDCGTTIQIRRCQQPTEEIMMVSLKISTVILFLYHI